MASNHKRLDKRGTALIAGLTLLLIASAALYLYARTYAKAARLGMEMPRAAFESILARALPALAAMICAAVLIAVMSLGFQTITQSRILTPSMIGFDSVFMFTQTFLVFVFGSASSVFTNPYLNYGISAGMMLAISMAMYGVLLRKGHKNLMFLLMFGLVLSGVLRSGARYLQVIMTEQDFNQAQAAISVTVNNMNTGMIYLAAPMMALITGAMLYRHRTYDVMALGPVNAQSLGVHYGREMNLTLMLISVGMSIATALIGSLTFLGLLSVNIARELLKSHRHLPLFWVSALISALTLVFGQGLIEFLQGAVPVTTVIDLVGCSYMFILILKENRI